MKFMQQIATKLLMCLTVLSLFNVHAHADSTYDQSTPEGALRLMFKAISEDNFVGYMSVVDFLAEGDELQGVGEEEKQQFLKMLEPKMQPIAQEISNQMKKVGGVKKVEIRSREDLADGTVSLQVVLEFGNGDINEPEEMMMVKRGNVYKFSPPKN